MPSSPSPLAILPLSSSSSGTPRAGPYTPLGEGDGDVVYTRRLDKGKGRAVDYEAEHEHDEDQEEVVGVYPPVNDDEAEERRIQETLALYASREMAVRRAKRESRLVPRPSSPKDAGAGASAGAGKRGSWWGMMGLGGKERDQLPFHTYSPTQDQSLGSPTHSRASSSAGTHPYPTPYDPPVNPYQPSITISHSPSNSNSRAASSHAHGRPRTDSNATITAASASPFGDEHAQAQPRAYSYEPPPALAPVPGGNGELLQPAEGIIRQQLAQRPEKWWHALCAWGEDLDEGGRDGQAGRTNPFE